MGNSFFSKIKSFLGIQTKPRDIGTIECGTPSNPNVINYSKSEKKWLSKGNKALSEGDIQTAIICFEAIDSNPDAQFAIGTLYHRGLGYTQNFTLARKWFRAAAEQGHLEAMYNFGLLHLLGQGMAPDPEMAFKIFKEAADKGFVAAQTNVGTMYFQGQGVEQNLEEAVRYLNMAADKGDAMAQFNLGNLYYKGTAEIEKDIDKAIVYWKKAARQGYGSAQIALNSLNRPSKTDNTISSPKNDDFNHIQELADQGDPEAQFKLGIHWLEANDYQQTAEWLERASRQGHLEAIKMLGRLYCSLAENKETFNYGISWLRKAAEAGDADAAYSIGFLIFNSGNYTKEEGEMAMHYMVSAAQSGHSEAIKTLKSLDMMK